VHLTETCSEEEAVHLIVQAEITAATEQDVEETMPLLHDLQARDLVPDVRLVVSSYVSGEVLARHAALGIELVGPLKQEGGWQHETGYGVSAFAVDGGRVLTVRKTTLRACRGEKGRYHITILA